MAAAILLFLFPSIILMQYIDPVDIYIVVLLALCTAMLQKIYSIN